MHEVLVNRLGDLSLPRKSVVRLTDRPNMTLDVYIGRRTTIQQSCLQSDLLLNISLVVGHLSVDISRALRVIYWATNHVRICFLNKI